jgi:hypothetical protein
MQISKVSFIVSLIGAVGLPLHAQSANSNLQNQALELLRQTIAQQPQQPAQPAPPSPPMVVKPETAAPAFVPATPAAAPTTFAVGPAGQAATPAQQQQALQVLRETMTQGAAAPSAQPAKKTATVPLKAAKSPSAEAPIQWKPAGSVAQPSTTLPGTGQPSSAQPVTAPPGPVPPSITTPSSAVTAPVTPAQPGGPKTKQERLSELLELYKADKISPAEYHAQRARILAEP